MRIPLFFLILFLGLPGWGQWSNMSEPLSFGLQIRTNGWGLSTTVPLSASPTMEYGLHLALHNVKHEKEIRVHSTELPSPGPFTLGKSKRLLQTDLSSYYQFKLSNPASQSLGVSFGMEAGLALAALRPAYVYVLELDQRDRYIQTVRVYDQKVHDNHEQVHGDAGWNRGFSSMEYQAGIHLGGYGQLSKDNDLLIQRFRLGLSVDYYPVDLGMLLDQQNQWFSAVVFTYEFGASK